MCRRIVLPREFQRHDGHHLPRGERVYGWHSKFGNVHVRRRILLSRQFVDDRGCRLHGRVHMRRGRGATRRVHSCWVVLPCRVVGADCVRRGLLRRDWGGCYIHGNDVRWRMHLRCWLRLCNL